VAVWVWLAVFLVATALVLWAGFRRRRSENQPDSAVDLGQPRVPREFRPKGRSGVVLALVGVALALLDGWIAGKKDLVAFAVVAAGFFTLSGGLLTAHPKALRGFERQFFRSISGSSKDPSPSKQWSIGEYLIGLVFLVPLLTLLALVAGLVVWRPALWVGAVAVILFTGFRMLQSLVGERIDERVKSGGGRAPLQASEPPLSAPPSAPHAPATTATESMSEASPAAPAGTPEATGPTQRTARALEASSRAGGGQVQLEIITADAMPPASAASQSRMAATRMRAPAIRRIYRKGVAWLAISTTLLALAYWLAEPAPLTFSNLPWFVAGLLVATLVLLSRRAQPWLRAAMKGLVLAEILPGVEVEFTAKNSKKSLEAADGVTRESEDVSRLSLSLQEVDESKASIRPLALRLLAAFWVAVALLRAAIVYSSLAAPWPLIFNTIAVASVFGCLLWIRRGGGAVERQYPYQPPLNLLALRVFNSGSLRDFLNLSNGWQWIGTRQLLDGPDSAGHKATDLFHYLEGRIDRSIIKDEAELHRALDAFSTRPDRRLRFPVNSMQCGDATWKDALQRLLDQADVVVMDLAGLSEQNRGVAYELGKLVSEVPLNRVVLLFDESTDLNVLRDILARACKDMAAGTPHLQAARLRVRLFDMGRKHLMNEDKLVGLLHDAAWPARTVVSIDPKRDWAKIRWSSLATSRPLRWVVSAVWWGSLLSMATITLFRAAHLTDWLPTPPVGATISIRLGAAGQGAPSQDPTLQVSVAEALQKGNQANERKDYAEAMRWYRKAADQGNAAAQENIGWLYHNGWGVAQDYAEAMRWYRKAADQGNAAAQENIGWLYQDGKGVTQDYAEAMLWYRKAADQGNASAKTADH
jgi:tetratricopeptide (TPR) repeat protein